MAYAHFTHAVHGKGQSAGRRARGECQEGSRSNTFEELSRGRFAESSNQCTVYDESVECATYIYTDDNFEKREENCRTISCNYRSNQTEYAERSEAHDDCYHFVANFCQTVDGVFQSFCFFTNSNDAYANEESEEDDLEHVSFNHCAQRVGREDIDDNFHDRRSSFSGYFQTFSGHIQASTGFYQYAESDTESDCKCGGYQVQSNGFETNATEFFNVTQTANTHNQRGEYQRYDNHFDQVHKDGAQGTNPSFCECSAFSAELQACDDTQTKGD